MSRIPNVQAYPIDMALTVLDEYKINYTIVETAKSRKSEDAICRVVRQRIKEDSSSKVLELTVSYF